MGKGLGKGHCKVWLGLSHSCIYADAKNCQACWPGKFSSCTRSLHSATLLTLNKTEHFSCDQMCGKLYCCWCVRQNTFTLSASKIKIKELAQIATQVHLVITLTLMYSGVLSAQHNKRSTNILKIRLKTSFKYTSLHKPISLCEKATEKHSRTSCWSSWWAVPTVWCTTKKHVHRTGTSQDSACPVYFVFAVQVFRCTLKPWEIESNKHNISTFCKACQWFYNINRHTVLRCA